MQFDSKVQSSSTAGLQHKISEQVGKVAQVFLIITGAAVALKLGLSLRFSLDEFSYAHAGWLIAKGQVPYRDFGYFHPPFISILFTPLFWILSDSVSVMISIRVMLALMLLFSAILMERLVVGAKGWVFFLAFTFGLFPSWMSELRPDALTLFLLLLSYSSLRLGSGALAGALAALAGFTSEKFFIYGLALLFGLNRRTCISFFAVGFIVSTSLYSSLLINAGIEPTVEFLWRWVFRHEALYPARDPFAQIAEIGPELSVLFALALKGVFSKNFEGRNFWIALFLFGCISFFIQRGPYPYSMLPACAAMIALAGRGLSQFKLTGSRELFLQLLQPALLLGIALLPLAEKDKNEKQLDLLHRIEATVPEGRCVYDNAAAAVTRPHVDFFFGTDIIVRTLYRDRLEREIPIAVEKMNCFAMVLDERFFQLSPVLKDKLREIFPNCKDSLCLRALEPKTE